MDPKICPQCQTENDADAKFCKNCGATFSDNAELSEVLDEPCEAFVKQDETALVAIPVENMEEGSAESEVIPEKSEKKQFFTKKRLLLVCVGVLVIAFLVFLMTRGPSVKSIELEYTSATITEGKIGTLSYTVDPENVDEEDLTWESSDETIATVSGGLVYGARPGQCTITVKAKNGVSAECKLEVLKAGPDLKSIFNKYCSSTYASVASDGSCLKLDTNPNDYKDYNDSDAIQAIYLVNTALSLPDVVIEKMSETRAMDGRITETYGDVEVSWVYHPKSGLEIIYSVKN